MGLLSFWWAWAREKVSNEYSFSQMINLISELNNPQPEPIYLIGHCLGKILSNFTLLSTVCKYLLF